MQSVTSPSYIDSSGVLATKYFYTVTAVNTAIKDDPSSVNRDPYGDGWLIKIKPSGAPAALLDASAYANLIGQSL